MGRYFRGRCLERSGRRYFEPLLKTLELRGHLLLKSIDFCSHDCFVIIEVSHCDFGVFGVLGFVQTVHVLLDS